MNFFRINPTDLKPKELNSKLEFYCPRKWNNKLQKTWTKIDGTEINICDMTEMHIINTIKMLVQNKSGNISALYSLSYELYKRYKNLEKNKGD